MTSQSANIANAGENAKRFEVYFAKTDMGELYVEEFWGGDFLGVLEFWSFRVLEFRQ